MLERSVHLRFGLRGTRRYSVSNLSEDLSDARFLRYWLEYLKPSLGALSRSNTQDNLNAEQVGNLPFSSLRVDEQRAIADYLDAETARIDALIAKKQQLSRLVDERLTEGIRDLVTGRQEEGERWEPGPRWLGPVPRSWQPLKVAWHKHTGSGTTPASDTPQFYSDNGIPWVTTSELREAVITATTKSVSPAAVEEYSALKVFPVGTVLVAMYGATVGRVGVLGIPATTNQACCALFGGTDLHQDFLYWWLLVHRSELMDLAYGAGQPNISQDTLRSLRIPGPGLEGQARIARAAIRLNERATATVSALGRQILLLQEHRQALITSAVTGQHWVPGVA